MCFSFQAFHICANDGQGEVAKILSNRKIKFFALKWSGFLLCHAGEEMQTNKFWKKIFRTNFSREIFLRNQNEQLL
jgi:hypothetical protein